MTHPVFDAKWKRTLRRHAKFLDQQKATKQRAKRYDTYGPGSRVYQTQLMHRAQNGKCANPCCGTVIAPIGRGRAMDRNPETGKPLAILCKSCSMALGNTRRNPMILRGLIDYLSTHS